MAEPARQMSVEAFLPWAAQQLQRWELIDDIPLAMSPERVIHGDTIYRIARAFGEAISRAKIPCRFVLAAPPCGSTSATVFNPT